MSKSYHRTYVPSYKGVVSELHRQHVTMREFAFLTELRFKAENENLLVDLSKDSKERIMRKLGGKSNYSQCADNLISKLIRKDLMTRKTRGAYMLNPLYSNKINTDVIFHKLMRVYLDLKRPIEERNSKIVKLSVNQRN